MSSGHHDHSGHRGEERLPTAHEQGPHEGPTGGQTALTTRSAWAGVLRSPTAWLLAALVVVAGYFALTGDPSRVWTALPYFAIAWMLLHHLGGHGGHARRHEH